MLTLLISHYKLDNIWLPSHTVHYMLQSGMVTEAVWFAQSLGDWKTALVLSTAIMLHKHHCQYVYEK